MGFYIKSVEATGPNVKGAIVSLTKGLNIIAGISNKGKTTILQFIEYVYNLLNMLSVVLTTIMIYQFLLLKLDITW